MTSGPAVYGPVRVLPLAGSVDVLVGPVDVLVDPADVLAAAVLACPFVVALSGGRAGEVATYLPGRQVAGVRYSEDGVQVNVVAVYGPTCDQIAAQVRTAVRALAGGRPVTVGIDDLDLTRRVPAG